jgi:hypothetical protein
MGDLCDLARLSGRHRGTGRPRQGQSGQRWLSSSLGTSGGEGRARSPSFVAQPGMFLVFKVAGSSSERVGVRLLGARDKPLAAWRGREPITLTAVAHDLTPHEGETLRVEVTDHARGDSDYLLADDIAVLLTR